MSPSLRTGLLVLALAGAAAAAPPAAAAASMTVRGRALDAAGRPLAGAAVRLSPRLDDYRAV